MSITVEELTPQQLMQVASMDCVQPDVDPMLLQIASHLSYLASQHHASEYHQMKNAHNGAPATAYVPLSILLPSHANELRVYQEFNARQQAWWLAPKPSPLKPTIALHDDGVVKPVPSMSASESIGLSEALSLALSSPLPEAQSLPRVAPKESQGSAVKTSKTHPINMSPIIPMEILYHISRHVREPSTIPPSTILRLPLELTLDRLTAPRFPEAKRNIHPVGNGHPIFKVPRTPSSVKRISVLQKDEVPTPPPAPHHSPKFPTALLPESFVPLPPSPTESVDTCFPELPPQRPSSSSASLGLSENSRPAQNQTMRVLHQIQEATSSPLNVSHLDLPKRPHTMPRSQRFVNSGGPVQNGKPTPYPRQPFPLDYLFAHAEPVPVLQPQIPFIGNLLLSSCPGKKVRLNGPVKGRGAIYRDLATDMKRMRDSGVGCIVCCLDNTELQFLGAPWEDYLQQAHALGLDILRIPTPEGFAPLEPETTNDHIDRLIHQYTLRGMSILVHCRGGVGRAGLVACCWMIKMGLCGWIREPQEENVISLQSLSISTESPPKSEEAHFSADMPSPHNNEVSSGETGPILRKDTIDLVERAIRVVRRQRSVKAIETFEQVQFLVEFVEYLRSIESKDRAGDSCQNS